MIGYVVALGILNLAAVVACWLLIRVWFVDPPPAPIAADPTLVDDLPEDVKPRLNLPAAWDKQLTRAHITVHSIIEGGVHIVEMDLDRYDVELHDLADLVQSAMDSGDDLELTTQARRLQTLVEQRLPELESTAEQLDARKDEDTQLRRYANQLAEVLTDELADLSDALHKISQLNFARDAKQAGEQLTEELDRVLQLAGELRALTEGLLREVRSVNYEADEDEAALGDTARFRKLQQEDGGGTMHTAVLDNQA